MTKFFTADLHLGDETIIAITGRPFKTSKEMNATLIANINSVAKNLDDLYVIGDFSTLSDRHIETYKNWLEQINPRVHLIIGNHDCFLKPSFFLEAGFFSVHYPYLEVEEFICIHDPAASIIFPQKTFLCGHIHTMWRRCKNAINVGVDVHNYLPISIKELRHGNETL